MIGVRASPKSPTARGAPDGSAWQGCQDDAPPDIPFKKLAHGPLVGGLPLQKNVCVNYLYREKTRVTLFRPQTPQNKSITI